MISIIVPAYNEADRIENSLDRLAEYLNETSLEVEVIVVAADSGDGTAGLAESRADLFNNFSLIRHPSRAGKGRDVASGMLAAKGDKVMFMDADLATPLPYIQQLDSALDNADIVIGVRDLDAMHESRIRLISSKLAHIAVSIFAVRGIKDTQCGFKGFRLEVAKDLFSDIKTDGWGFDFEVLALAKKRGYSIAEIQIHDWSDPKGDDGLSGDSQITAMAGTMVELIKLRWNIIRGNYDK